MYRTANVRPMFPFTVVKYLIGQYCNIKLVRPHSYELFARSWYNTDIIRRSVLAGGKKKAGMENDDETCGKKTGLA